MAIATETTATTAIALQHIGRSPGAEISEDTIQTEVDYLFKDPKHEYEKPYDLKYDAGGIIPRTNMASEPRSILIHNFRPLQHSQSFEEYGFMSAKIDCALTASEFRNDETVKEVYYPAIKNLLRQTFPDAAEMQIIEHAVRTLSSVVWVPAVTFYKLRKRHPQFPIVGEDSLKFYQPARVVHIGESLGMFSQYGMLTKPQTGRQSQLLEQLAQHSRRNQISIGACWRWSECPAIVEICQRKSETHIYSFWKSFQGPGNDWPLALCDWRTVDCKSELIAADAVYHDRYTENQRLYYSLKHKWYYIKDLGDDEVIMIRQTDSDLNDFEGGGECRLHDLVVSRCVLTTLLPGVAHTSFHNPKANENAPLRESIELRAFVFFT